MAGRGSAGRRHAPRARCGPSLRPGDQVGPGEGRGHAIVRRRGVAGWPARPSSRYARRRRVRLVAERDVRLYNPPLQVVGFVGTRRGDPDRGPQVRLRGDEAALRMLSDGEMAWIEGPRRQELATIIVDDAVPKGGVVVRDIAGLVVSEIVTLRKPDLDTPPRKDLV